MKATEFLTEHKKSRKAKKYTVKPEKPRNFVAKNATTGGAGAHKDKKKAAKQGDVKHKNKEVAEGINDSKIAQLEEVLGHLERIYPLIQKISKENHYVFEQIESEVSSIYAELDQMGDSYEARDTKDFVDDAVQKIRQANGAVYSIEKNVKNFIRDVNTSIEDARDEEEFESRFSSDTSLEEGSKTIPFAGKKVGHKEGPAGQLKGTDPKGYPKGKLVGGGM